MAGTWVIKVFSSAKLKVNTNKVIKARGIWSGVDCTDIVVSTQQTDLKTNLILNRSIIKIKKN